MNSLNTSLAGRLRNTNLPKSHALLPLFEAIVNSIHSIDERIQKIDDLKISEAYIKVKIIRSSQITFDKNSKSDLIGFEVIDNGIGFNSDNFQSFKTLDSEYKISLGCRGVGRLLWLKAFNKIRITSSFLENSLIQTRSFDLEIQRNLHNDQLKSGTNSKIETTVQLMNISKEYDKAFPKSIEAIEKPLLEHCLWYFLREGGAPHITLEDGEATIDLFDSYESHMLSASQTDSFVIKDQIFEITHVKLKANKNNKHSLVFCAANRVVKEESLTGKIPGLFGILNDETEKFVYMCFLTSDYLTNKVNSERIDFNISETVSGLFTDEEISLSEIRESSHASIAKFLEVYLKENISTAIEKVINFVATKAPRYRPILNRISDKDKAIDPNISEKELELKLHSHLVVFEAELLSEGHDLMKPDFDEDDEKYSKRIEDYLSKANDLKKSDLANYVTHRKVILDLLGKSIERNADGKYAKEEVIHKLIMPMQKDSNELFSDESNLWLIDERLAFHNYLASDKTLKSMPITKSDSTSEPDLLAVNIYDNPLLVNEGQNLPLATITVVEIKRPMRNDAREGEEKNPIEQALDYLKKVRKGGAMTKSGRLIPNSEDIPGFCYIICDITESIKERCEYLDLQVTSDKLGYFGYHKQFRSYIEVISFDRLLNMAKARNRAFFDKLGLPTN
jgi:hypothetical protein